MSFHENLRTLRLARGLTQPALAEKAGIEQSYLSKLENGRSRPSEDVLTRLAQALDVKPETLQNGDETEERTRRWQRGLVAAGLALAFVGVFLIGRATAIYPLTLGQVISGARASDVLTQQLMAMAPQGVDVIMLSRNGPTGGRVSISGRTTSFVAMQAYMQAIHSKFGGSFTLAQIEPASQDQMHHFNLDYVMTDTR